MSVVLPFRPVRLAAPLILVALLAACASLPTAKRMSEEECMTRVMYFESNRSSPEGMLAVGTVVMNRKASGKYPTTVCGVVGQNKQFAPGVLSKPMGKGRDLAARMARQVLRGAKYAPVGRAMFFHTAGYSYPYSNMHYVTIAGGNAFYEKRKNATSSQEDVRRRASGFGDARPIRRPPPRRQAPPRSGVFDFYTPAPQPVAAPAPVDVEDYAPVRRAAPSRLPPMSIEDLIGEEEFVARGG